jgi:hypothetical protein
MRNLGTPANLKFTCRLRARNLQNSGDGETVRPTTIILRSNFALDIPTSDESFGFQNSRMADLRMI